MQNDNPADPNPINSLFDEQPGLRPLLQKAQTLQQISALLAKLLPPDLWQHCQVQNIEGGCLVLAADHAAWATHLRYQQTNLLSALRQHRAFSHVGSVRVRVIPTVEKPSKPSRRLSMSAQVGSLLTSTANGISNEKLRDALLRLAKRATR